MVTVAIPVWNSRPIAWLVMESLCNQLTSLPWELIIYEEKHEAACGTDYFAEYKDRLMNAGCSSFRYLSNDVKVSLGEKWSALARAAHKLSKMFCLCDADNYYQKYMIEDTLSAYLSGYDFLTAKRGYFYNITDKSLALYDKYRARTGLQMSYRTELIRGFPAIKQHSLLNGAIFDYCKPEKIKIEEKHTDCLCTHGQNNISGPRGDKITALEDPFYGTDKKLEDIVPQYIADKLREL